MSAALLPATPKLTLKTRLLLSTSEFIVDASFRSNGTFNRFLFNLFDLKSPPRNNTHSAVKSVDVTVDSDRDLWFRLYIPTTAASDSDLPVIFYFHGGGYVMLGPGSKSVHDLCIRMAREVYAVVVSVNYRLAPEHKYPAQFEDGYDVLKFVDENRGFGIEIEGNVDLRRCFVAGDSAGGNLAHHIAVKLATERNIVQQESALKEVRLIGLIAVQPFFGGEDRTEAESRLTGMPLLNVKRTDWMWKAFLPEGSDRDHPVVNVTGPKSIDLSEIEFPTTLVFIGGFDPLCDWQKRYYEWLMKSGKEVLLVEYPNAIHAFYAFPDIHESGLFIEQVKAFVHNQFTKRSTEKSG